MVATELTSGVQERSYYEDDVEDDEDGKGVEEDVYTPVALRPADDDDYVPASDLGVSIDSIIKKFSKKKSASFMDSAVVIDEHGRATQDSLREGLRVARPLTPGDSRAGAVPLGDADSEEDQGGGRRMVRALNALQLQLLSRR